MTKKVYLVLAFKNNESIQQTAKVFQHYRDSLAYGIALDTNESYDFTELWEVEFY